MSIQETPAYVTDKQARLYFAEYLTRDEVAELIGVSLGTVKKWIHEDGLAEVDLGERTKRIKRTTLDAFLLGKEY